MFPVLENVDMRWIGRVWESVIENNKISAKESYDKFKYHNLWFGKGCSKLLDQR
jgi:hypothetical protein